MNLKVKIFIIHSLHQCLLVFFKQQTNRREYMFSSPCMETKIKQCLFCEVEVNLQPALQSDVVFTKDSENCAQS